MKIISLYTFSFFQNFYNEYKSHFIKQQKMLLKKDIVLDCQLSYEKLLQRKYLFFWCDKRKTELKQLTVE